MRRLYVLIDKSLKPVYGCVQGGHAVAQYLLDHPKQAWDNQYLIYLYADTEKWSGILEDLGADYSAFFEPDLDYKMTAIAVEEDSGRLFRNLKTVR